MKVEAKELSEGELQTQRQMIPSIQQVDKLFAHIAHRDARIRELEEAVKEECLERTKALEGWAKAMSQMVPMLDVIDVGMEWWTDDLNRDRTENAALGAKIQAYQEATKGGGGGG